MATFLEVGRIAKVSLTLPLQMGLQELLLQDLGGFVGKNEDDELYARWLQYGVSTNLQTSR